MAASAFKTRGHRIASHWPACNRTRRKRRWRCSTRSTPSIEPACARHWRRKSASRGVNRFYSSRSTPVQNRKKPACLPQDADAFLATCHEKYGLKISGLMCIPPLDEAPGPHFALTAKIAKRNGLQLLSMGMSADFATAIALGATHVRVGSAIFGEREVTSWAQPLFNDNSGARTQTRKHPAKCI